MLLSFQHHLELDRRANNVHIRDCVYESKREWMERKKRRRIVQKKECGIVRRFKNWKEWKQQREEENQIMIVVLRENNREERLAKREKAMAMIKVRSESDEWLCIIYYLWTKSILHLRLYVHLFQNVLLFFHWRLFIFVESKRKLNRQRANLYFN